MSDFIRPELREFFRRWREVMFAAALGLLGLRRIYIGDGINFWLGVIMIAIAVAWAIIAVQRVRFSQDGTGPGIVQVRERRIGYFGPESGGIIDIADIARLEIDPATQPSPSWVLIGKDHQNVIVPVNAAGADALFDAFSALPGIDTGKLLHVLSHTPDAREVIWQRLRPVLH